MRKFLKVLIVACALAAGVAVAPALQAHDIQDPQSPTMSHGGMMNMMEQMSQRMETCNKLMQGALGKRDRAREAPPPQQQ